MKFGVTDQCLKNGIDHENWKAACIINLKNFMKKKSEKLFWNKACKNVTTGRTQYLTD